MLFSQIEYGREFRISFEHASGRREHGDQRPRAFVLTSSAGALLDQPDEVRCRYSRHGVGLAVEVAGGVSVIPDVQDR